MGRKSRVEFVFEFSLRIVWMYTNWTFTFLNYVSLSQMVGERRYITKALLLVCASVGAVASVYFAGVVQCIADNMFRRKGQQHLTEVPVPRLSTNEDANQPTKPKSRRQKATKCCPKRIIAEPYEDANDSSF